MASLITLYLGCHSFVFSWKTSGCESGVTNISTKVVSSIDVDDVDDDDY